MSRTALAAQRCAQRRPRPPRADVRRNLPLPRRCGGLALIAPPRATDRDPINPSAMWTPSTAAADLTERSRADGGDRFRDRTTGQEIQDTWDVAAVRSPSGRSRWRMSDDLAGRRGTGSEDDRPLQRRDRRGHQFDGAQTVLFLMPGRGSDAGPPFLPRAHGVASLRALVALASRILPPIDLCSHGSSTPLNAACHGHAGGSRDRWGSKRGSPGEPRAVRFGHEPAL